MNLPCVFAVGKQPYRNSTANWHGKQDDAYAAISRVVERRRLQNVTSVQRERTPQRLQTPNHKGPLVPSKLMSFLGMAREMLVYNPS